MPAVGTEHLERLLKVKMVRECHCIRESRLKVAFQTVKFQNAVTQPFSGAVTSDRGARGKLLLHEVSEPATIQLKTPHIDPLIPRFAVKCQCLITN